MSPDRQSPGRDELLDHEADGIREFDNALPRWWLYGFYFTIVVAAAYMLNFHVLAQPLLGKAGMVAEYNADMKASGDARASQPRPGGPAAGKLEGLSDAASLAGGKAIFDGPDQLCFSCHRADLGGLIGPNLTDDQWLHGCSVDEIVTSIKTGYPLKGMMPFGSGKPLSDQQVLQVASYIRSKHGSDPPNPKPIDADHDKVCR